MRLELVSLALHQPFFLQKPLFSCSSHWHSQPLQPPSQGHAAEEAAQSRPPRRVTPPPVPSTEMPPGSSHPRSWRPTRSSSKPLPAAPAILWGHRDTAGGRGPGFVPSALRSTPGPAPRGDVGAHLREGASCLQEFAAVLRVTDPDVPKVLVFHDITALWGQEGETWERSPCTLQPPPYLGPQHCPCSPLVLAPRRQLSPTQPHVPTLVPTQPAREGLWHCSTCRVAWGEQCCCPLPSTACHERLHPASGFQAIITATSSERQIAT